MKTTMAAAAMAAGVLLGAGQVGATTLFADNFNTENGGADAADYTGWANFTATGGVDLVGGKVFLPGDPDTQAVFTLKDWIAFDAGDTVLVEIALTGGNAQADYLVPELIFENPTPLTYVAAGVGLDTCGSPAGCLFQEYFGTMSPSWDQGAFRFHATAAGRFKFSLFNGGGDWTGAPGVYYPGPFVDLLPGNAGLTIDNIVVTTGAVPEPASWAMLLMGFFGLGSTLRQRRAAFA